MTKEEWIAIAAQKLAEYEFSDSVQYAESLYQTYIFEGGEPDDDPLGVVAEDVTYWGNDE